MYGLSLIHICVEKTRTVIKDGSFQYLTDDAGIVVTEGVALFSGDGGTGFFNYMYNGIVSSSAIDVYKRQVGLSI